VAKNIPGRRAAPPTTAVVQVGDDGSATLYLGTEPVEHANGVDAAAVMRVLIDYAATIDAGLQITTQMPDGTWTRHRLDPDGTITPIPRNSPPGQPTGRAPNRDVERSQRNSTWARVRTRVPSRGAVAVALFLLAAALLALLTVP
jgi:hypothetical protein